jgi:hypothetical protein
MPDELYPRWKCYVLALSWLAVPAVALAVPTSGLIRCVTACSGLL